MDWTNLLDWLIVLLFCAFVVVLIMIPFALAKDLRERRELRTVVLERICWRCGGSSGRIQRDRLGFHICLWVGMFVVGVGLLVLPFLPKRVYCTACGARVGEV